MILAVDFGSTNLKTAVFAEDGRRLGEGSSPMPYLIRTADQAEMCPIEVEEALHEAVASAVEQAGVDAACIERAGFTSQAQTFCVCDADGEACSPFIGWTDLRAAEEARILQQILGAEFHSHTGWPGVHAGLLISKAMWLKKHGKLAADQKIVLLPSYFAMRFGAPHIAECNLAAMSGLFSIPLNSWWPESLDAAGVSAAQLGNVTEIGEPAALDSAGKVSWLPGLRQICLAGNDHTAGAFGSGCGKNRSVLTLGTAGVFYRFAGEQPGPFSSHGLWGPYPGGGFYELRVISHACSALDWADDYLFGGVNSRRFVQVATMAPPGSGGIQFDPDKWGSVAAWNREGSREAMARAVLEGIADKLKSAVADVPGFSPSGQDHEIVLLGGGSRLGPWVEILEEKLGCVLRLAENDGLAGAAKLASRSMR